MVDSKLSRVATRVAGDILHEGREAARRGVRVPSRAR